MPRRVTIRRACPWHRARRAGITRSPSNSRPPAEFRVVATASGSQADPDCQSLSIDESGRRLAANVQGADSASRCW